MKQETQEADGEDSMTVERKARKSFLEAASNDTVTWKQETVSFRQRSMPLLVTKLFGMDNAIPVLVSGARLINALTKYLQEIQTGLNREL